MFSTRYWIFFLIVLAAISYSMFRITSVSTPITSPQDAYSYEYLTLNNGLKVLLVQTPDAEKAAAAVTVDVGSGDDPKGREGLAHFLEHMLFLGTEPYPDAGEYQAYINRHGGSHNAFTAYNQTTYFFDIDNTSFTGALDRFAPFFISPTFDATFVEREKNAVNAEFKAKYKDDFRRIYSAEKQAMNPDHSYASFATGNLDTLADRDTEGGKTIRDELLSFYDSHYSADRMTLVLAGNYSLTELKELAKSHFSDIPVKQTQPRDLTQPLFLDSQLPMDMNIEPVKEIRRIQFSFPLPESQSNYQQKPVQFLSHLLGHEGEGSLLALLKEKGWAEGLSAGRSIGSKSDNLLVVQVQLTRAGLLHIDHITQALLHYIDLLKEQPIPAYLYSEQQQLSELMFRFQEQSRLTDYVIRLSTNLLTYPSQDVIFGDYRWEIPSAEQMKPYLDGLDAHNMLRTLIAPKVTTDTIDPWYNTPIRIRPLNYQADAEFLEDLKALHLPVANPFVPSDFELHADAEEATPKLLIDEAAERLWYYPEHEFRLPKTRILIQLQQASVQNTAKERMLAQLYVRAIKEALNTYSYPASLAGLHYNLTASGRGIELSISGYQHKIPVLLDRILEQMQHLELSAEEFDRYKTSIERKLNNQLKNKPYERTLAELRQWLFVPSFDEEELLLALNKISHQEVLDYSKRFGKELAVQSFVHGSISSTTALELSKLVTDYYPATQPLLDLTKVVKAPLGKHQKNLELDHQDKALLLYVQGLDNSDYNRARYSLLGQILSTPYYQRLRTEEQLGYVVFATQMPLQTVPALAFIVQAPNATPEEIMASSQRFFKDFELQLQNMTAAEFLSFQQGLIMMLNEKPKNMGEKFARFWRDIEINRDLFDTNQAIAREVLKLTLDDIQALYKDSILEGKNPWLIFTQGGKVSDAESLDKINTEQSPLFPIPFKQ